MAQQQNPVDQEKLCCSICLDILKDPVTIPCGHSYCMSCIKSHWDEEDGKKIHSCPQCRQTFRPRPALVKNTMLADLVEDLKTTGLRAAPADHCYAGPEDVACDYCTGRKRKATKSCLQCLVSYCEEHLQPHYEVAPLKKHKLTNVSANLQENICTCHNEEKKVFCRTDQLCICYLCSMDEHKGHDTVSAEAEMTKRQKDLGLSQKEIQRRIQHQENCLKMLQQEVEAINCSADKAVRNSERLSTELVNNIERGSLAVKHKIRSQQVIEVKRVKELQEKLEQELVELRRKDTELVKLLDTGDQRQLLHNSVSLLPLKNCAALPRFNNHPLQYFENVTTAVSEARGILDEQCTKKWTEILLASTDVDVLLPQDPKTSAEFSQYAFHLLILNPNTAHAHLIVSGDNRKATAVREPPLLCGHPDRFMDKFQVLSSQHLTGRCYWEVQWGGPGVSIAVTYKNIARKGKESEFGNNDRSWALECSSNCNYNFKHNGKKIILAHCQSSRVSVFLDYTAGILCFYEVSQTTTLLHRVQTTFTQQLYAGLGFHYYGSTAEFCEVK